MRLERRLVDAERSMTPEINKPSQPAPGLEPMRRAIREATDADESSCVTELVHRAAGHLSDSKRDNVLRRARQLVRRCRGASHRAGTLDAFLQQFGLSNREGVALMCLAEALLRIPDRETINRLIAEKVQSGDWEKHLGKSASTFVNASVWGLMLTGRMVRLDAETLADQTDFFRRLTVRLGEPVVRKAVLQAMRILSRQYVFGRTIGEAMHRAQRAQGPKLRYSFDLLGEGARTYDDAERHHAAYSHAISELGDAENGIHSGDANSVSVKLSALHPRFEHAQRHRLDAELAPKLKALALLSKKHSLGLSIDAEEAARLEPTLDIFECLARDPDLRGWNGLGFVLQAYQKRAPAVVEWLIALARATDRRLMVRLVKGAYWDAEIKRAQEQGLFDYPVFTRKANTDLSYEVCAARLLAAPGAVFPQFATHNAYTMSLVQELSETARVSSAGENESRLRKVEASAPDRPAFEYQRLHGMGELLYSQFSEHPPVRVYAPVGPHRDLLPYLVRRLLENGANSSFVNRFLDQELEVNELVQDPLAVVRSHQSVRHPSIPRPPLLYCQGKDGETRSNAAGIDLDHPSSVSALAAAVADTCKRPHHAAPVINGKRRGKEGVPIRCPADRQLAVGSVVEATSADVDSALGFAVEAQPGWNALGGEHRAAILDKAAELLESHYAPLIGLIAFEAGRTLADGLAEVREAVDFCRYYAMLARRQFSQPLQLPGPTGETNELELSGRGVFACISPWNFPLAIFMGQVAAALAAGNSVVAKPAEQTPLIAAEAVRLLHEAGVPMGVLHLLPGDGERVGGRLVRDARTAGVAFTGSIETAQWINRELAKRHGPIAPIIAETGGQNAMLVDSTALPEQVVDDVVASAFKSAGQRCSALRVLYLQDDIADDVLRMLSGAMRTLSIGCPWDPATDVGPVIDDHAVELLRRHRRAMLKTARLIAQCTLPPESKQGSFFPPCAFEIDSMRQLDREIFGPILHVVRFSAQGLDAIRDEINGTGYGLTLGVHSRREGFAKEVFRNALAGNVYINRNIIGAVVGVNPFGGRGLSGTGPKAGGPHYLLRFATERTLTENVAAKGGNAELFRLGD